MSNKRNEVWFGGVHMPRLYATHGQYRPELAVWLDRYGDVLEAQVAEPGEGVRALRELLDRLLERERTNRRALPPRLALHQAELLATFDRTGLDATIVHERAEYFDLRVSDYLSRQRISGLGFAQGYVGRGVGVELARELFAASSAFLALDVVDAARPRVCAVALPSHGFPLATVWIGRDDASIGSGLRIFRDLDLYRAFMRVERGEWEWEASDDASLLGLGAEHVRWLNQAQREDIKRHRLPSHPPGLAPVVVATDADGVDRPHGADDVERIVLVTRALTAALREDAAHGSYEVGCAGRTHIAQVWLRHPDATDEDFVLGRDELAWEEECAEDELEASLARAAR